MPHTFVGQLRSDTGNGTGFLVKERVVATAAHVVEEGEGLLDVRIRREGAEDVYVPAWLVTVYCTGPWNFGVPLSYFGYVSWTTRRSANCV